MRARSRGGLWAVTLATCAVVLPPQPASGQGAPETIAGAALGTVAGTVVTAAVLTSASLDEIYLWDTRDLIGWPLLPVATGLIGGAAQGATDWDSVERGATHALALGVAGAAVGAVAGELLIEDDRGPWAGGVIGAGVGVLTGWLVGSLTGDDAVVVAGSVPLELGW